MYYVINVFPYVHVVTNGSLLKDREYVAFNVKYTVVNHMKFKINF